MGQRLSSGKTRWIASLTVLTVIGLVALGWAERRRLFAWYAVHRLTHSEEAGRDIWIERLVGLEDECLPRLVACLTQNDARACANTRAALERLASAWDPDDPRRGQLGSRLANEWPRLSVLGQQSALDVVMLLSHPRTETTASLPTLAESASRLVAEAVAAADKGVHQRALAIADLLMERTNQPETIGPCRELTQACLRDEDPENRIRAVRLAGRPGVNLLEAVVPLLRDPVAEVRRAALLAVGPATEVLATDDLLYSLHDADGSVRRLCEKALRGRGLRDEHIQLGRFLTDKEAKTRLQVLDCLRQTTELEPGVWIRRLSHDPAAAVRAAAVRAAVEFKQVELADRIGQMAQNDPSPTVRQLAVHYLSSREKVAANP